MFESVVDWIWQTCKLRDLGFQSQFSRKQLFASIFQNIHYISPYYGVERGKNDKIVFSISWENDALSHGEWGRWMKKEKKDRNV